MLTKTNKDTGLEADSTKIDIGLDLDPIENKELMATLRVDGTLYLTRGDVVRLIDRLNHIKRELR